MNKQRNLRGLLAALLLCGSADPVMADGNLLAVGGMLRASNSLVYEKLIELAGGAQQARIAIMPTASGSLGSSKRFQAELEALGVPAEHIRIVGIDRHNYQDTMNDPAVVAPLREASAVWFVGGDQARIARALFNADGSPSLAMQAVQAIYDKGGVVAGTSAGASILGARMPT
ncbi:Type 1 glutamine amidotransferase-like domain-containing protein, partial [Pseudomonas sp. GW6]